MRSWWSKTLNFHDKAVLMHQMQLWPVLYTARIHFLKDLRGIKTTDDSVPCQSSSGWQTEKCLFVSKNKVKQGTTKWKTDILLRVTAEKERLGDGGRDGRSVHDWDKRRIDGEPGRSPLPHTGIPEIPPTETVKQTAVALSRKDIWRTYEREADGTSVTETERERE